MPGADDDYGDAFKKTKLKHDQELEAPTEAKRLQAEADADGLGRAHRMSEKGRQQTFRALRVMSASPSTPDVLLGRNTCTQP